MKLSILTPSIPERSQQAERLANEIKRQIDEGGFSGQVEHLVFSDNRQRSIGAKRQALVDIARGEYFAFVDDDDEISTDYVAKLIDATATHADVITFKQRCIYNGAEGMIEFGLNHHDHPFKPDGLTLRAPWHVCAWRRERVFMCQFAEINYGEDLAWCLQARRRISNGFHVDSVLHTYRHDAATTAAPEPERL